MPKVEVDIDKDLYALLKGSPLPIDMAIRMAIKIGLSTWTSNPSSAEEFSKEILAAIIPVKVEPIPRKKRTKTVKVEPPREEETPSFNITEPPAGGSF